MLVDGRTLVLGDGGGDLNLDSSLGSANNLLCDSEQGARSLTGFQFPNYKMKGARRTEIPC